MAAYSQTIERTLGRSLGMSLLATTAGAAAMTLLAQVRIDLPVTPVPITLQTLGVLLLGAFLGPRLAAASLLQYLVLGLMGLPCFAGFTAGPAVLFGPTGGYLLAFPIAAAVSACLYDRLVTGGYPRRLAGAMAAGMAGMAVIYLGGVPWLAGWLAFVQHQSFTLAVLLGAAPFLVVDLLKSVVAASIIGLRRA